jgi:hypothetical protein
MVNGIGTYTPTYYNTIEYRVSGKEEPTRQELRALKRSGAIECQECANRKYVDGSNEGDVSFKAPGHISPQSSAATVMAHEQEHVANAYESASKNNGQVLRATVTLDHAICSECGRSYVSGGTTGTTIKYSENNPYGSNAKAFDAANGAVGANVDIAL